MDQGSNEIDDVLDNLLSNRKDDATVLAQFADAFLVAGSDGAFPVKKSDFAFALPARRAKFAAAGCRQSRMVEKKETRLSSRYVMVQAKWLFEFEGEGRGREDVETETTLLVDVAGSSPKVIAYIAHEDIFKTLEERGVLRQ